MRGLTTETSWKAVEEVATARRIVVELAAAVHVFERLR